jgi:hypothetical protein
MLSFTVRIALPDHPNGDAPDVPTQLETLLDQVWRCEAEWRFDDRLDLAARLDTGSLRSARREVLPMASDSCP